MLEVFSDLSEKLNYNMPGFPLYARKGELRTYERYAAACHWHPDLEFIWVQDGAMDYFVNGQTTRIHAGEGIIVNSKRLHYGYSAERCDCTFWVVVVHPALFSEAARPYFESVFGPDTEDYILLTEKTGWMAEASGLILRVYDAVQDGQSPLFLTAQAASLCALVAENIQPAPSQSGDERAWQTVWRMTGFIQQHLEDKITLDDIAAAGSVCRSRCCRLFGEYIGQSPNAYLTRYRVGKSCEMLRDTQMSVCEVALSCGFQNPSYFTQVFQKETGLVPRNYRENHRLRSIAPEAQK